MPRPPQEKRGRAIVVGAGETGRYVAMRLYREGLAVVVIGRDEEALGPLGQAGCSTVVGDARKDDVVALARPEISEVAVIAIPDADDIVCVAQALRAAASTASPYVVGAAPVLEPCCCRRRRASSTRMQRTKAI